ncbi:hypothetical protein DFH06DRAFT_1316272 [Mycena polygramma]|nr:hypothetical protein DFH06DRAFT_1316272 [Mycena polygramma]
MVSADPLNRPHKLLAIAKTQRACWAVSYTLPAGLGSRSRASDTKIDPTALNGPHRAETSQPLKRAGVAREAVDTCWAQCLTSTTMSAWCSPSRARSLAHAERPRQDPSPPLDRMALAAEVFAPYATRHRRTGAGGATLGAIGYSYYLSQATLRLVQDGGEAETVESVGSRAAGRLLRLWGQQHRRPLPRSAADVLTKERNVHLKLRQKVSRIYRKMGCDSCMTASRLRA